MKKTLMTFIKINGNRISGEIFLSPYISLRQGEVKEKME